MMQNNKLTSNEKNGLKGLLGRTESYFVFCMILFGDNNVFQTANIQFHLPEAKINSLNLDHPPLES